MDFIFKDGKIEAEDFTSRLYRELNSSPQPYLVPFLKVISKARVLDEQQGQGGVGRRCSKCTGLRVLQAQRVHSACAPCGGGAGDSVPGDRMLGVFL